MMINRGNLAYQMQNPEDYLAPLRLLISAKPKIMRPAVDLLSKQFEQQTFQQADRWIEKYRVMGEPFPGPWSFKYHPWTRGMLAFDGEEAAGQKAAQMAYTEVALGKALFTVVQRKRDVLYVLPAKTPDATDFSSARFDPALELSPLLKAAFSSTKNVGLKRSGSNSLYIRGSRSPSGLKSIPISAIFLDEVEEMEDDAVALVRERSSGQNDFQLWQLSTPSVPGAGINKLFERSRQEHFFFKCPCCSRRTELTFPECLVITADNENDPRIKDSHLICKECKGKLEHAAKHVFLASGIWVPKYPDRDIFGPHINQMYSSARACHPVRLAKAACRARLNSTDEQEFYNSKLGLPHIVAGSNVTRGHVELCVKGYRSAQKDMMNGVITCGIDVGTRCHYEIVRWQFRESVRSIDINVEAKPQVIMAGWFRDFHEADTIMRKFSPAMTVIDQMPDPRKSMEFARRYPGRVKLCHYSSGLVAREIIDHGEIITVDRTFWLDLSLGRFINGTIELPGDISEEYKSHVCALVRIYRDKKSEGKPTGEKIALYKATGDDHHGHARNYSEMALKIIHGSGVNMPMTGRVW